MDKNQDTELLLALVASLLEPPIPDTSVLLDAIMEANGDVEAAAKLVASGKRSSSTQSGVASGSSKKARKGPNTLGAWLNPSSVASSSSTLKKTKAPVSARCKPTVASTTLEIPPVDLMKVLKQAPSAVPVIPRITPLTLRTPVLVAQHTPCTLHHHVLPSELACRLFHTMMDASKQWSRNKMWLFDRLVESPHLTSFFARKSDGVDGNEMWQEAARYWYNGRATDPPSVFPSVMEEACTYIEKIVNEEMHKRSRYPLEWDGKGPESDGQIWRANVAASNCYQGTKEAVGPHTDALTYLGPYPTIASLSLGTQRVFRVREVIPTDETTTRQPRTFNIPLAHNSLTIMHASTQERFKHSIPPQPTIDLFHPSHPPSSEPSNCRINITFRFYRPDFHPKSIPRCKCDVPTALRPDMKHYKVDDPDKASGNKYWWTCAAGAQNEGKGCGYWKVMDMKAEGRGPVVGQM